MQTSARAGHGMAIARYLELETRARAKKSVMSPDMADNYLLPRFQIKSHVGLKGCCGQI